MKKNQRTWILRPRACTPSHTKAPPKLTQTAKMCNGVWVGVRGVQRGLQQLGLVTARVVRALQPQLRRVRDRALLCRPAAHVCLLLASTSRCVRGCRAVAAEDVIKREAVGCATRAPCSAEAWGGCRRWAWCAELLTQAGARRVPFYGGVRACAAVWCEDQGEAHTVPLGLEDRSKFKELLAAGAPRHPIGRFRPRRPGGRGTFSNFELWAPVRSPF